MDKTRVISIKKHQTSEFCLALILHLVDLWLLRAFLVLNNWLQNLQT